MILPEMVVNIRLRFGPKAKRERGKSEQIASATAALLTPVAVAAGALALWQIGADLQWTARFFVASGLFSHWQVWLATGVVLQLSSSFLNRLNGVGPSSLPNSEPDIPKSGSQPF